MRAEVINSLSADGPVSMETQSTIPAVSRGRLWQNEERRTLLLSKHDLVICRTFVSAHLPTVQTPGSPERLPLQDINEPTVHTKARAANSDCNVILTLIKLYYFLKQKPKPNISHSETFCIRQSLETVIT